MQKRLWRLLVLPLIVLSGCGQQYNPEDAQTVQTAIQQSFLYSDVFSLIDNNPFVSSGVIRESLGLYSNTSSDSLSTEVEIALTTDTSNANTFSSIVFSGSLEDKVHADVFNGSGTVHYISLGSKKYINRHEWYIDLWAGNAESFIVRMILDSIRSQWMLIDDNELINSDILRPIDGSNILDMVAWIRDIVRDETLFIPNTSSIPWLFPLTLSSSWDINSYVESLYTTIGKSSISNADVSFVGSIQTIPEARLVIETLRDNNDSREISGYVWIRHGSLTLAHENKKRSINRTEKRRSVDLEVSVIKDNKEQFFAAVTVTPKNITNAIWWLAYQWEFRFALSANNLITFPVAGLYGIYIVDRTQFFEPTRYILMSQLFGDEYGIARILESE
jgi:hypothetical protein